MMTSDYRGILFNFGNAYWAENRDLIPAVCYAMTDRRSSTPYCWGGVWWLTAL